MSEQHHLGIPLILRDEDPPTHLAVRLHELGLRLPNRPFDPSIQNPRTNEAVGAEDRK